MLLPPKWALFTSIALRPATTRKYKIGPIREKRRKLKKIDKCVIDLDRNEVDHL
jgi:hypothetical protein